MKLKEKAEKLKNNPSKAERKVYDELVLWDIDFNFREPLFGKFIPTFIFPNKLILEIDHIPKHYDELMKKGYNIVLMTSKQAFSGYYPYEIEKKIDHQSKLPCTYWATKKSNP